MSKVQIGFAAIGLLIAFWRLIVMPYQQGADLKGCIDSEIAKGFPVGKAEAVVDVCSARAKFPTF